jgi:hypothetical protein
MMRFSTLLLAVFLVAAPVSLWPETAGATTRSAGSEFVFRAISQPALRGDYVLAPEQLRGEQTWRFMGRDPELGPYPY